MFKMSPAQINELSNFAILSDTEIRSDLSSGYIKNENDYTSNFTGAFRRNINSYTQTGLTATSMLLDSNHEQQMGCDATIIITSGGESKIAIFEAKWPRLSKAHYQWDYSQTSTGLSHYSDQLNRQKRHNDTLAIFEMFYCEFQFTKQPSYMKDRVSSCVWHDDAMLFKNNRPNPDDIWSQAELESMLQKGNLEIGSIIREICKCNKGRPIQMDNAESIAMEFRLPSNILHINIVEDHENIINESND